MRSVAQAGGGDEEEGVVCSEVQLGDLPAGSGYEHGDERDDLEEQDHESGELVVHEQTVEGISGLTEHVVAAESVVGGEHDQVQDHGDEEYHAGDCGGYRGLLGCHVHCRRDERTYDHDEHRYDRCVVLEDIGNEGCVHQIRPPAYPEM